MADSSQDSSSIPATQVIIPDDSEFDSSLAADIIMTAEGQTRHVYYLEADGEVPADLEFRLEPDITTVINAEGHALTITGRVLGNLMVYCSSVKIARCTGGHIEVWGRLDLDAATCKIDKLTTHSPTVMTF